MDVFLGEELRAQGISREKIKLAIMSGQVRRNGQICEKPNTRLFPGDEIIVAIPRKSGVLQAEEGDITVLWRDAHLAVINKPAGVTVHPAPGLETGTLAHRLLHHFPELAHMEGPRPGIVHRLDKDTSGLMLVALDEKTRLALSAAFADRKIHKTYLALVHGVPSPQEGSIREPLGRDPVHKTKMAVVPLACGGKEAHSEYTVLYADPAGKFSLLRVAIHTGRTHQIRVHARHIGHSLIGDAVYGEARNPLPGAAARQMLHAWQLSFAHPLTGEALSFCSEPPEDFLRCVTHLGTPMQRVVVTGSPGGGKSTLTNALRDAGLPTWSADDSVRALYTRGNDGWYILRRRFGEQFVPDDTADVDKKALFAAMTASEEVRLEVEHLIHPLVRHDLETFWQRAEKENAPVAIAEVPLYLESGWRQREAEKKPQSRGKQEKAISTKTLVAGVYCPFAKRRERMAKTRGWSEATIAVMEAWQWPEEKKIRAADLVVDNSGDLAAMQRHSQSILHVLASLRERQLRKIAAEFHAAWGCGAKNGPNFSR